MFIKHVDIILISAAVGVHFALEQFQRLKKRLQKNLFQTHWDPISLNKKIKVFILFLAQP